MPGTVGTLADLILPASCAGCGAAGASVVCDDCTAGLEGLVAYPTRPVPPPLGLPPCLALGAYDGPLRQLVLAYKDGGRHRLARPLAVPLAKGVAAGAVRLGLPSGTPIVVVPVPSSAGAARQRHGDHMRRLARHIVRTLRVAGWPAAVARPAVARPRADSVHLSAEARAVAAQDAFRVRTRAARRVAAAAGSGACVIVVDDVVTTGATLASFTTCLASARIEVRAAVTLAATVRRITPAR